MKSNLIIRMVIGLGFVLLTLLIAIIAYNKNLINLRKLDNSKELTQTSTSSNFVTVHFEKDTENKQIKLVLSPHKIDEENIVIGALEIDLKIYGDNFEKILANENSIIINKNLSTTWTFPIKDVINLQTGEVAVKLAGYTTDESGLNLDTDFSLLTIEIIELPETDIFVSEIIKDNTHLFRSDLTTIVPLAIE